MTTNGDEIRPLFPGLVLPDSARVGLLRAVQVGPAGDVRDAVTVVKPTQVVADSDWLTVAWDDDQELGDPIPSPSLVTDQFTGPAINATLWTVVGSPTVSGGLLRMPVTYPAAGIRSKLTAVANGHNIALYTLTTTVGAQSQGVIGVRIESSTAPGSHLVTFARYQPNPGYLQTRIDSSYFTTSVYDAAAHANIRIRVAAPTVFFETSANGTTWTTLKSATAPAWLSSEQARVYVFAQALISQGQDLTAINTVDRVTWA